jgi:hypothetical protein
VVTQHFAKLAFYNNSQLEMIVVDYMFVNVLIDYQEVI